MRNKSLREQLVEACRVRRIYLKETLGYRLSEPSNTNRYPERWRRLDDALAKFQAKPGNFHSRNGVGLAELIHNAEPTNFFLNADRDFFFLKPTPNGFQTGPAAMARNLVEAYREKGFHGGPLIDPFEEWVRLGSPISPDLICSELSDFFDSLAGIIEIHERKVALAMSREKSESFLGGVKERVFAEDKYLNEIFALKCCEYCFRLIPIRSGKTKVTIGETCALHDQMENRGSYLLALARHKTQLKILDEQKTNRKVDIESNADNPVFVPRKLHILMKFSLSDISSVRIFEDNFFDLVKQIFSTEKNTTVDLELLNSLLGIIKREFPPIARANGFSDKIHLLIEKSQHTPERLFPVFGGFVHDVNIPLHPTIIATYLSLFYEESWFAQEHAPDYYGSDRGKGRPIKNDPVSIVEAALIFQKDAMKKSEIIKTLANMFGYTDTRVRQILKEQNFPW